MTKQEIKELYYSKYLKINDIIFLSVVADSLTIADKPMSLTNNDMLKFYKNYVMSIVKKRNLTYFSLSLQRK